MSNTSGNPENQQQNLDEDLRVQAVADAAGALSKRDRQNLEYQEAVSEPEVRKAIWEAREGVMKQMRDDLPDVEPDRSLKHRVLAKVLRAVENDFVNSTERSHQPRPKRNWIERFVGGGVSPIWRLAALVMITVSAGLFWSLTTARTNNNELRRIARDNETEHFRDFVGLRAFGYLMDPEAQHVAFKDIGDPTGATAFLSYFDRKDKALFIADGLPTIAGGEYCLRIRAPGLEKDISVYFTSQGQVAGVEFTLPSHVDPIAADLWVISIDAAKVETKIMQNIS